MLRSLRLPQLSLRHVTWSVFIYCGVVAAAWPRRTYDIWWHLATGKWMVQNGQIPHTDPFTWSKLGEHWIAHEWGWELPMYLLYAAWGHDGLMALRILVAAVTCALLAWLCLRRGATPLAAMAAGGLAIFAARPLFNDRPQIATMPLFVAMLCLIEQTEEGKPRWLLIGAPLLMLAWVNVHGGFIYGFGLMGLYFLCKAPGWIGQLSAKQPLGPCPGMIAGAIGLAAVACLANPNGIAGAIYPLEYIFGGAAWHTTWISEYESPDFSGKIFLMLGILIVATTAVFAASGRRSRLWDVALVALFLYTALKWQRNMGLFAVVAAAPLSLHLSDLLGRIGLGSSAEEAGGRRPTVLYWAIIVVLLISAAMSLPSAARMADAKFKADMPVECTQYIKDSGLQGRMFNTYRWGGYLIWHLWPEHKVMVDGRADVLGKALVSDWQKAHKLNAGWEQVLDDYKIDYAIVSVKAPLVRGLEEDPDWRLVCSESTGRLFVRRGSIADQTAGTAETGDAGQGAAVDETTH